MRRVLSLFIVWFVCFLVAIDYCVVVDVGLRLLCVACCRVLLLGGC